MTIPGPLGVSMAFGASMPCGAGTSTNPTDPKKIPLRGQKIDKTLIFGRFSEISVPKNFREKQGGFLIKRGILNYNTPDTARTAQG